MATFGITPISGYPLPPSDAFPEFIQFQDEGANLGGPDADTVNFTGTGITATRGTGENVNVVTVDVSGGGGSGSPVMAFNLTATSEAGFTVDTWSFVSVIADATVATWDVDSNSVVFASTGVCEIHVASAMYTGEGVSDSSTYRFAGDGLNTDPFSVGSSHASPSIGGVLTLFTYTDFFLTPIVDGDLIRHIEAGFSYGESGGSVEYTINILIRKLS